MCSFISAPFLPKNSVTLAAVSCQNQSAIKALKESGIEAIKVYPYKNLTANPEAAHADMQLLPIGGSSIIALKGNDVLNNVLADNGFEVRLTSSEIIDFKYPNCVKLNCAVVGNSIICNERYIDETVRNEFSGKSVINVSQGYAKCSTAIVAENAVITSDDSVYKAAVRNKIDCLKITEGHIELCERYHGFIGGACFKAEKGILAFIGDIRTHPDYINIKSFCLNYGVNILSLMSGNLTDIGGVVPLKEAVPV